jgi:hypothetical protein
MRGISGTLQVYDEIHHVTQGESPASALLMGVDFSDSACAEDCCIDHVIISSLVGMLPLIWVNRPESTALFVASSLLFPQDHHF